MKKIIKKLLLKHIKNLVLDSKSTINYSIINNGCDSEFKIQIHNSSCHIIECDEGCHISDAHLYGNVHLGRFVSISGPATTIKALQDEVLIKSFSSIGPNVCIVSFSHNIKNLTSSFINYKIFNGDYRKDIISSRVIIEEDVCVGANCTILPGVVVGRGSIISAGSVITKDVPRYSVVGGNPGMVLYNRFDSETIKRIEKLEWWNWTIEQIKTNEFYFDDVKKYIYSNKQ